MARLTHRKTKNLYSRIQNGGSFSGPVYRGRIHRHRGGFFPLKQMLGLNHNPLFKGIGRDLKRTAINATLNIGKDLLTGKTIHQAIKNTGKEMIRNFGRPRKKRVIKKTAPRNQRKMKTIANKKMKGGRLGKLPRQTYTTLKKSRGTINVFGD